MPQGVEVQVLSWAQRFSQFCCQLLSINFSSQPFEHQTKTLTTRFFTIKKVLSAHEDKLQVPQFSQQDHH